jgi:hypothetical protein
MMLISCETESSEEINSDRISNSGKQLTIINNSDFAMTGKIFCYGAEGNLSVNPNILVVGNTTVPANNEITYKNFAEASISAYRISQWHVLVNGGTPTPFSAASVNNLYGQFHNQSGTAVFSQSKFANWRYLKVNLTTATIPGFVHAVPMTIQLPAMSSNNSGEVVINMAAYGLHKNLHLTQSSTLNSAGNTILQIDSELVDQNQ